MKDLAEACRALADPGRLRVLRLLLGQSLNASEITAIVGASQPAVSRQLKMLRAAGLVREERAGAWVYFEAIKDGDGPAQDLLNTLSRALETAPDEDGDADRLAQVLAARREVDSLPLAGAHTLLVPGRSWAAWARALVRLLPAEWEVADLGCGDGGLALELARGVKRVVGIEPDAASRARASARLAALAVRNVEIIAGTLEDNPLPDRSVDLCLLSQVLHHSPDPARALREAARVLRPGGRVLIMDLEPHDKEWVRERLGDLRLGISGDELRGWLAAAGFEAIGYETLTPMGESEKFRVNVTTAARPRGKQSKR